MEENSCEEISEALKQRIRAKAHRIQRYDKRKRFFEQNRLFNLHAKKFYREINGGNAIVNKPPNREETAKYWKSIWENEEKHNETAEWLPRIKKHVKQLSATGQKWEKITAENIKEALKNMPNWKTPGPNQIPNFWLKKLNISHSFLANALNEIMEDPNKSPKWLTEGNTYLVAKDQNTQDPKNYRPITCLPTIYKTLTSILAKKTYSWKIFSCYRKKKKGCRVGSFGNKDQLLINRMISEITKNKKGALSQAWIDYKKLSTVYHTHGS